MASLARISFVNCYCPSGHLIANLPYHDTHKTDRLIAVKELMEEIDRGISVGAVSSRCDVCGSDRSKWGFETVQTEYKAVDQAHPYITHLEHIRFIKAFTHRLLNHGLSEAIALMEVDLKTEDYSETSVLHPIMPIPKSLHSKNLRTVLGANRWAKLRRSIIEDYGLQCQRCRKPVDRASALNAHEAWAYDTSNDPAIATLEQIVPLCWHCHACEHFHLTMTLVLEGTLREDAIEETIKHFCRVNQIGPKEFVRQLQFSMAEATRLDDYEWKLNFGAYAPLTDPGPKATRPNRAKPTQPIQKGVDLRSL